MAKHQCYVGLGAVLLAALSAAPAQERVLTKVQRLHVDAEFSPDGAWISYQSGGKLYVQPQAGGAETLVFDAGQQMTYLWESNSFTLVTFANDILSQAARTGQQTTRLADLSGQGIQDLYFIDPSGRYVYGHRRTTAGTIVCRIELRNGKLEDLITTIAGVSSVDLDPSGKKLLITAVPFVFTYDFYQADLDGKNVSVITSKSLTSVTDHGRWLDDGKTFLFNHNGFYSSHGSGMQLWSMDVASATPIALTWLPKVRAGVPSLSKDRLWAAIPEQRSAQGLSRALVVPASGGGELVLSVPLYSMDKYVRFSPNGASVVYAGHPELNKGADVRVYDLGRQMRLAPTARVASMSQLEVPFANNEVGVVFLGLGLSSVPIPLPGIKGAFELDLTLPLFLPYSGGQSNLQAPFVVPNDTTLIGAEVYLQGLRLVVGPTPAGDFTLPLHIAIAPK